MSNSNCCKSMPSVKTKSTVNPSSQCCKRQIESFVAVSAVKRKSTPVDHQTTTSRVRSDSCREAAWSVACAHRRCLEDASDCPALYKTQQPSMDSPQAAAGFIGLCGFARNSVAFWIRSCHQAPLVHWRISPSRSVSSLGHHCNTT
ncbi:hypothetical protein HN873_067823, partial [Arachis hypogaea]